MKTIAMLAFLLAAALCPAAAIELRPGAAEHSAEVYVVGEMSLQAWQIALSWPTGVEASCLGHAAELAGGFFGGGDNADLTDGRGIFGGLNLTPIPIDGEAWLGTVGLSDSGELAVRAYASGGIPTTLLPAGGGNEWDGVCRTISLPEPSVGLSVACLAVAAGIRRRGGRRRAPP